MKKEAEIVKINNRLGEISNIFKRIYEDNINGKLGKESVSNLLEGYENEQSLLRENMKLLENEIVELKERRANIQSFLNLTERYLKINELSAEICRLFIDKVVVFEEDVVIKSSDVCYKYRPKWNRVKKVQVIFNYIGEFVP